MRSSSADFDYYVDAPQRWADARVRLKIVNEVANVTASTDDFQLNNLSQLEQTYNGKDYMSHKFATFEGTWTLDGSCAMVDGRSNSGFWERYTSNSMTGDTNCTVKYTLDVIDVPGITIFFDDKHNQWCSDFTITFRDVSDTIIHTETVVGHDSAVYKLEKEIIDLHSVTINFTKTSEPRRYVRFSGIEFGIVEVATKRELTALKIIEEITPDMSALPYGVLEYAFDNSDRRYDPSNPDGIYGKLRDGLQIDVEIGLGNNANSIEYVDMGRYYFKKSEYAEGSLTAKIIAHDVIAHLDKTIYPYGIDARSTDYDRMGLILPQINNRNIPYNVGIIAAVGAALPITSVRECVRLIAQAAAKTCIKRNDALSFVDVTSGTVKSTVGGERMIGYPDIVTADKVGAVAARVNRRVKTAATRSVIFEGTIGPFPDYVGQSIYDSPPLYYTSAATDVVASVYGLPRYVNEYLHCCEIDINSQDEIDVVIEGYRDETSGSEKIYGDAESGKTVTINNPLINSNDIAERVAEWMHNLQQLRTQWSFAERGDPRLQIGDKITLDYRGTRKGVIIKQEFNFDGALSAHTTILEVTA